LLTAGYRRAGIGSLNAAKAAAAHGIETMPLDRLAPEREDIRGLLLGCAAIDEREIRRGGMRLAATLEALAGHAAPRQRI
jgi:DNA-binding transcriptional MocR family regulator